MPRPMKLRQVAFAPGATFFKPVGVPMQMLEAVTLTLEEVEAIRLKDMEDMHQEECAKEMGISRGTFHQILKSAHGKLADAIVNGMAIRVEGGNFAFPGARFRCRSDGHEWSLPPGPLPGASAVSCPTCNGRDVQPVLPPDGPGFGRGHGHGPGGPARGGWHGMWGMAAATPGPETRLPGRRGGRGRGVNKP